MSIQDFRGFFELPAHPLVLDENRQLMLCVILKIISVKHIANEFLAESFNYDKATDSYICPAGAVILTSLGTWHNKKGEANETSYRF